MESSSNDVHFSDPDRSNCQGKGRSSCSSQVATAQVLVPPHFGTAQPSWRSETWRGLSLVRALMLNLQIFLAYWHLIIRWSVMRLAERMTYLEKLIGDNAEKHAKAGGNNNYQSWLSDELSHCLPVLSCELGRSFKRSRSQPDLKRFWTLEFALYAFWPIHVLTKWGWMRRF